MLADIQRSAQGFDRLIANIKPITWIKQKTQEILSLNSVQYRIRINVESEDYHYYDFVS